MNPHLFLFSPGCWLGSGKITFNGSSGLIRFYTSWLITKDSESRMTCLQHVEMQGVDEKVINHFVVDAISEKKFRINLQSESIGNADGTGIIEPGLIAWEFHSGAGVEGFEVYELQENGDYMLHAEYASPDQFRTIIDARIWQKDLLRT